MPPGLIKRTFCQCFIQKESIVSFVWVTRPQTPVESEKCLCSYPEQLINCSSYFNMVLVSLLCREIKRSVRYTLRPGSDAVLHISRIEFNELSSCDGNQKSFVI